VLGDRRHLVDHGGHVEERLRGDAAHVEADAAEHGVALDEGDPLAEVRRAEGGGVAAGAGAEDDDVEAVGLRHRAAGGRCGGGRCRRRFLPFR
jgi:hypothetical protein